MTFTPLRTLTLFNTQCDIHLPTCVPTSLPFTWEIAARSTRVLIEHGRLFGLSVFTQTVCKNSLYRPPPFILPMLRTTILLKTTVFKQNTCLYIDYMLFIQTSCGLNRLHVFTQTTCVYIDCMHTQMFTCLSRCVYIHVQVSVHVCPGVCTYMPRCVSTNVQVSIHACSVSARTKLVPVM